jgi:hypothetical protein
MPVYGADVNRCNESAYYNGHELGYVAFQAVDHVKVCCFAIDPGVDVLFAKRMSSWWPDIKMSEHIQENVRGCSKPLWVIIQELLGKKLLPKRFPYDHPHTL